MATSAQDKLPLSAELSSMTSDQDSTPAQVDGLAFARPYGESLFKLPRDLYIPSDVLGVFPRAFEGPLDLLLYLARRQNFNVLDIPLVQVTRQYLVYTEQIRATNLELVAEYLLMTAMLIEIKLHMLLLTKRTDSGSEPEDPHVGLVCRLSGYEQMKLVAQKPDTVPQLGRDFLRTQACIEQSPTPRYPDVNSNDLRVAWADVLHHAKFTWHHKVSREEPSMCEHANQILRHLQYVRFMEFTGPFEEAIQSDKDAPIVVVNFVAMPELSREPLLGITQAGPYAPIYVRLAYSLT